MPLRSSSTCAAHPASGSAPSVTAGRVADDDASGVATPLALLMHSTCGAWNGSLPTALCLDCVVPLATPCGLELGDDPPTAVPRAPVHLFLLIDALTRERDRFFPALLPVDVCPAADFFD